MPTCWDATKCDQVKFKAIAKDLGGVGLSMIISAAFGKAQREHPDIMTGEDCTIISERNKEVLIEAMIKQHILSLNRPDGTQVEATDACYQYHCNKIITDLKGYRSYHE